MAINDIQISQYVTLSDFEDPDTKEVKLHHKLLILTEVMMLHLSPGLMISSGYRTPEHNEAVGGAKDSYHIKGMAVDLMHHSMSLNKIAQLAYRIGFTGIIVHKDHVHLDIRPADDPYYEGFTYKQA